MIFVVCDKFISKTNKNVKTKIFYFNYIVRKLLHYRTVESTLLKSRTPYLINSLEMNPRETKFSQSFFSQTNLFGNSFSESPLEGSIQHSTILLI